MEQNIKKVRLLSKLFDSQFEIAGVKFGIDPIINLVPYLGDIIGAAMSLYLLKIAKEMKISNADFVKMLLNIVVDFIVGLIPFVGVIFDVAYKANIRNLKILEKYVHGKFVEGQIVK